MFWAVAMFTPQEKSKYLRILGRSELFASVSSELLEDQAMQFEVHRFGRASYLPEEVTTQFCIICRGRLRLFSRDQTSNRELTTALIGPGDVFDVIALLEGNARLTTAQSMDELELLAIPIALMRGWISRHPAFNKNFVPYLARMLDHLTELSIDLALHSTGVRLAKLLLRHLDTTATNARLRLIDNLSTTDLANLIGTVRGVVSRDIKALRRMGILESGRRHLEIKDVEALRKLVEGGANRDDSQHDSPSPGLE